MPEFNATDASIVTGGGRGIGRAITLRLARDGPVIAVGRTPEDVLSVCCDVTTASGLAEACIGDIRYPATAAKAIDVAKARGWEIANLICNAGIGKSGATHELDPQVWKDIFDTNVHGSFHFVRACLPSMLARGRGAICLISSVAGLKGVSHDAAYCASKHALVGLARSLALEYGKHGIVVVPVCPGYVEGEMTTHTLRGKMRRKGLSEEQARHEIAHENPRRTILPAEELADVIALICAGKIASVSGNPLILGGTA